MRLFQAALDTCLGSPFFASLVYALSRSGTFTKEIPLRRALGLRIQPLEFEPGSAPCVAPLGPQLKAVSTGLSLSAENSLINLVRRRLLN